MKKRILGIALWLVLCAFGIGLASTLYNFGETDLYRLLKYAFDTSSGHSHDGTNSAYIADPAAIKKTFSYQVEDLGVGTTITSRPLFVVPTGVTSATFQSASVIAMASSSGIGDSYPCVMSITDSSGNAIFSKTFNSATTFPSGGLSVSLGTASSTYATVNSGSGIYLNVTSGTGVNMPLMTVQTSYKYTN